MAVFSGTETLTESMIAVIAQADTAATILSKKETEFCICNSPNSLSQPDHPADRNSIAGAVPILKNG
jgi:hypothetical protein